MPATKASDVFIPEIATEVATATFPERLALGFTGAPFVEGFPPEAMLGDEGDAVKFPRWNAIGEFTALTEDVAMTTEKMDHSTDMAVVQVAGKAAEVTDWASLASRGDPSEELGRQIAIRAAQYVDARLIVEAETTALVEGPTAATITWDAFVSAIVTHWGDKAWENLGGLVVHSKVAGDLYKLDEFISTQNNIGLPDFRNRARGERTPIGMLGGYPVYVSDRLTTLPGPDYRNLILKRGALGLKFQRELLVEFDRDILKKSDVIAADVRFSVHLMFDEPSPVIAFVTD